MKKKIIVLTLSLIALSLSAFCQKVKPEFDITFKDGQGNILVVDGFDRFWASKVTTADIFKMQADITNLQRKNTVLQNNLNDANKTISNLENKITQLNRELSNTNNKVSQLERYMSNLEKKISDLERKIK
jgi:peptidoglycan hydrolase CwlO-like protein